MGKKKKRRKERKKRKRIGTESRVTAGPPLIQGKGLGGEKWGTNERPLNAKVS